MKSDLSGLRDDVERAMISLRGPALDRFVAYMTLLREEEMERLASASNKVQIHRLQGSVRTIQEFLDLIEGKRAVPTRSMNRPV